MFLKRRHGIGCGVKVLREHHLSDSTAKANPGAGPCGGSIVVTGLLRSVISTRAACVPHGNEPEIENFYNAVAGVLISRGGL